VLRKSAKSQTAPLNSPKTHRNEKGCRGIMGVPETNSEDPHVLRRKKLAELTKPGKNYLSATSESELSLGPIGTTICESKRRHSEYGIMPLDVT
jgi:hypothetical protein